MDLRQAEDPAPTGYGDRSSLLDTEGFRVDLTTPGPEIPPGTGFRHDQEVPKTGHPPTVKFPPPREPEWSCSTNSPGISRNRSSYWFENFFLLLKAKTNDPTPSRCPWYPRLVPAPPSSSSSGSTVGCPVTRIYFRRREPYRDPDGEVGRTRLRDRESRLWNKTRVTSGTGGVLWTSLDPALHVVGPRRGGGHRGSSVTTAALGVVVRSVPIFTTSISQRRRRKRHLYLTSWPAYDTRGWGWWDEGVGPVC